MTERIEHDAYQIAWPGTRVLSGGTLAGAGTWEIIDHSGCDGDGLLRAYGRGDTAPRCPGCGQPVCWQLTHLAPSVAADHRDVGPLP